MKILFIARHRGPSNDNDDEGAVSHALRVLGHEVVEVDEHPGRRKGVRLGEVKADLCLFFKHPTVSEVIGLSGRMPCCLYFFDMVESVEGDPTLAARSEHRKRWFADVLPHVVAGFCTDGDWVAKDGTGKLVHLTQGFDERNARLAGEAVPTPGVPEVVFTGMVHHGRRRADHIAHLRRRWGDRFGVVGNGGAGRRVHGRELADLFAGAKVVVAPDGPTTDRYTSNRLYLTTGLGGYLLHPRCLVAERQYDPGREMRFYESREQCDALIEYALRWPDERARLRKAGHEKTLKAHLYRHRVEELLRVVKGRV